MVLIDFVFQFLVQFYIINLENVMYPNRFFCVFSFLNLTAAVTMEIPTVKSCGPFDLSIFGLMIGFLQMAIHVLAFMITVRFGSLWMAPITSEYRVYEWLILGFDI